MRQRIAIFLPDLRGSGAERVNLDLSHEFAERGRSLKFILHPARGESLEEKRSSYNLNYLNAPRSRNVSLKWVPYLRMRKPDALLAALWLLTVVAPPDTALIRVSL